MEFKPFLFLLLLLSLVACAEKTDLVCFDKTCFKVEVVSEQEELMKGLMFREHLDENAGMLFVFPESDNYPFWMKNTLISLDMIWINENFKVVQIQHKVRPCESDPCPSYDPKKIAKYVLEINAGLAKKSDIEIGDVAKIKLLPEN